MAVVVDRKKMSTSLDIFCGDVSIAQDMQQTKTKNQTQHPLIYYSTKLFMYAINYYLLDVHGLVCVS